MLSLAQFLLTLLVFKCLLCVKAGLFIVDPRQESVCHGSEPCTVTWLDDGSHPLLSEIGVTRVGLFTGKQQLVQTIEPVDVSQQHSLTFTPISSAGPNSDTYYISFSSTSAKQNNSLPYTAFSPFFRLDKMTGSFATPDPSATLSIPIPSSITASNKPATSGDDILSTITIGTIFPTTTSSATLTGIASSSHSTTVSNITSIIPSQPSSSSISALSPNTSPVSAALSSVRPSGLTTTVLPTFTTSTASPLPSLNTTIAPPSTSSSSNTNGVSSAGRIRGIITVVFTSAITLFFVLWW